MSFNRFLFKINNGMRLALVSAAEEKMDLGEDIHSLLAIYNFINMLGKHKDSFSVIFEGTSPLIEMAELAAEAAGVEVSGSSSSDEADADVYIVCPGGSSTLDQLAAVFARLAGKPAQVYLLDPAGRYNIHDMTNYLKVKANILEENCPAFKGFVKYCQNNLEDYSAQNVFKTITQPFTGISNENEKNVSFFLGTLTMGNIKNVFEVIKLAGFCATNDYSIVYGAEASGLMQALALAARQENGRVVGVPMGGLVAGIEPRKNLSQLMHCDSLEERKDMLMENSKIFVICAGGPGTMGELTTLLNKYPNGEVAVYLFDPTCVYTLGRLQSIESELSGDPEAHGNRARS